MSETAGERNGFHQGSVGGLLIAQTLEVESLLNEHTVELVPSDAAIVIAICLQVEPIQAVVNLFISMFQLLLPGLEVLESLRNELFSRESVFAVFEGIFEEAQDVLVDVDG